MGAGDTCLTVIGFVTDKAKWRGCKKRSCVVVEQSGHRLKEVWKFEDKHSHFLFTYIFIYRTVL